jgi:hypothetical protein
MNIDSAVTIQKRGHLGWRGFSIATLLAVVSLGAPDPGQASDVRKVATPTSGKADLAGTAGTTAAMERTSLRNKSRKKPIRSWPMTFRAAEDRTDRYSENFFFRTTPADFDPTDPDLVDIGWEDYYQDGCKRISSSRISCRWHVESDWVDFFDEQGGYLYTDFYVCRSNLEVWHPRGRTKTTSQQASKPACFWESERAGARVGSIDR